jgi:hypothetical protein
LPGARLHCRRIGLPGESFINCNTRSGWPLQLLNWFLHISAECRIRELACVCRDATHGGRDTRAPRPDQLKKARNRLFAHRVLITSGLSLILNGKIISRRSGFDKPSTDGRGVGVRPGERLSFHPSRAVIRRTSPTFSRVDRRHAGWRSDRERVKAVKKSHRRLTVRPPSTARTWPVE